MSFKPVEANVNFVALEKNLVDFWYSSGIVKKYLLKNNNSQNRFSFLDGPITANNPMGIHHAWGRTLKDLYQRYHNLLGDQQRFQNGFDCQGLWVEVEVEKELGFKTKKDIESYGIDKFVEKCKDRVRKFADMQTQQSKRLGYFMDWDNSYFTMSDENNYMIWFFIKKCWENGWLYKGRDSVPWCPRCGTAISQHEILTEDYKEISHKSVFFKLKLLSADFKDSYLLVWTTTPWTIPANVAAVVDPQLDYVQVENNGQKLILSKKRLSVLNDEYKILKTFKGKQLINLKYQAVFDNLARVKEALVNSGHRVIASDPLILPVLETEGTGIIHVATGAGSEDFSIGKKENLPVIAVIDEEASYLEGLGTLSGKNAKYDPELIFSQLKDIDNGDYLYKLENYKHRYPACWRCKSELVWRVVDEWYIAMDKKAKNDKRTLRERMVKVAKKINWLPDFGLDRELDWLKNMHDWLISKKRYWGLALPIWKCSCGEFQVIGSLEELKNKATSGWQEFQGHAPHRPWIDKVKVKCACGKTADRIKDVGNPWLDAGIVSFSTLIDPKTNKPSYTTDKKYWQQWYPADFITESFPGQFKNWFYSLIAMATVLEDEPSFKTVLGFGTLLGEDGRPMHKSWGNSIEFNEGADKIGVDVMRFMYSNIDPSKNLLFGYGLADQTRRQFHIVLWNVYKFFVTFANLNNWQPKKKNPSKISNILDKWILARTNQLIIETSQDLNNYHHHLASAKLQDFLNDLSLWYIRRSRDRVNPVNKDKQDLENCLATIHQVLVIFSRVMAPFMPFISEQIYTNLTGEESVHLSSWPVIAGNCLMSEDLKIIQDMKIARLICETGHAQRKKEAIKVRQPLAKIKICCLQTLDSDFTELIKNELNIKDIEFISKQSQLTVELDTKLTPQLILEGNARDIVRKIQQERKKMGLIPQDIISVTLPEWPEAYEEFIKEKTICQRISKDLALTVTKINPK